MITISSTDDKISKNTFVSMDELKIFIYENYGYPDIKEKIEESWYKNGKPDLEKEMHKSANDMKVKYDKIRANAI